MSDHQRPSGARPSPHHHIPRSPGDVGHTTGLDADSGQPAGTRGGEVEGPRFPQHQDPHELLSLLRRVSPTVWLLIAMLVLSPLVGGVVGVGLALFS